jgi:hypothetical protein
MPELSADEVRVSRDFAPVLRAFQERLAEDSAPAASAAVSSAAVAVSEADQPEQAPLPSGQVLCPRCREYVTPTFQGCCPTCRDFLE